MLLTAMNLHPSSDSMAIFTTVILLIHDHEKSFHLLRAFSSSVQYSQDLTVQVFHFLG